MDQPQDAGQQAPQQQAAAPAEQPAQAEGGAPAPPADVNALEAEPPEGSDKPLSNQSDVANAIGKTDKQKVKLKKPAMNLYIIVFIGLFLVGGGVVAYSVSTSSKKAPVATINNQALSQQALNQLANTDASIGGSAQTLTVQSNAVFNDQVLAKGNLTTAGNLQTGGSITTPSIVVSNTANLGTLQAKSLQVANGSTFQGNSTFSTLTVSGSSTFSGVLTASEIDVTKLVISGSGGLVVPNHLSFPASAPDRSIDQSALGDAGSATVSGSDTSGEVHVNTGNNPAAGCFIQVTFNQPYAVAPRILISPMNSASATIQYYATTTTSSFSVCSADNPSPGTVYLYDYLIMD